MDFYTVEPINPHVFRLRGRGNDLCYLVVGAKKAALIDTGAGYGNLLEVVRGITDLPLVVLLTHGHADHVGGIGAFEEVFLHPRDRGMLPSETKIAVRRRFLQAEAPELNKALTVEDFLPEKTVACRPLRDRQKIDLGKAVLEVVEAPSHTGGSVCFLERRQKLLFAGDVCTPVTLMLLPASTGIITLQKTLDKLEKLSPSYNRILTGHGSGEAPVEVFGNLMECTQDILAECDDMEPFRVFGIRGCLARRTTGGSQAHRADGKYGNIAYPEP